MPDPLDDFRMDRTAFRVASFGDDSTDLEYWLSRPPEERIAAVEMLRRMYHGIFPDFKEFFELLIEEKVVK